MEELLLELSVRAPFAAVLIYFMWAILRIAEKRNEQEHERVMSLIAKLPESNKTKEDNSD